MGDLAIHHLRPAEVDKAYVLASLGYRSLDVSAWRRIVETNVNSSRTSERILFAQDEGGRPRGLLVYSILPTLAGTLSLRVERLIAFDLMDPSPVAGALVTEVMRLARDHDCESFSLLSPLDTPSSTPAMVIGSPVSILHRVF